MTGQRVGASYAMHADVISRAKSLIQVGRSKYPVCSPMWVLLPIPPNEEGGQWNIEENGGKFVGTCGPKFIARRSAESSVQDVRLAAWAGYCIIAGIGSGNWGSPRWSYFFRGSQFVLVTWRQASYMVQRSPTRAYQMTGPSGAVISAARAQRMGEECRLLELLKRTSHMHVHAAERDRDGGRLAQGGMGRVEMMARVCRRQSQQT